PLYDRGVRFPLLYAECPNIYDTGRSPEKPRLKNSSCDVTYPRPKHRSPDALTRRCRGNPRLRTTKADRVCRQPIWLGGPRAKRRDLRNARKEWDTTSR